MPRHDAEAVRELMTKALSKSGGMGKVGEDLPQNDDDEKAFGNMEKSQRVQEGLDDFVGSMSKQFSRAEELLNDIARSLDGALQMMESQDEESAKALTPDDVGL